jgi:hypothetical protein
LIDTLRRRWTITGRSAYANRAVRFSLAFFTSPAEVELALSALRELAYGPRPPSLS